MSESWQIKSARRGVHKGEHTRGAREGERTEGSAWRGAHGEKRTEGSARMGARGGEPAKGSARRGACGCNERGHKEQGWGRDESFQATKSVQRGGIQRERVRGGRERARNEPTNAAVIMYEVP